MITRIATVTIYVDNQDRALRFWTERVGFKVRRNTPRGPQVRSIEVAPPESRTRLSIYPRNMAPDWGVLKSSIIFECEDLQDTYEQMAARGVDFTEAPYRTAWGAFAKFQDPDGNEFLLKGRG